MNISVSPNQDEMGKFLGVVQAFPEIWDGLILDVGCRSGRLKGALLDGRARYWGLDLSPPAHVIGNLEVNLPFGDETFNTVAALDVLEHTDDIYNAFSELCRVSCKYVVITLPNEYDLKSVSNFCWGSASQVSMDCLLIPQMTGIDGFFRCERPELSLKRWENGRGLRFTLRGVSSVPAAVPQGRDGC